MQHYKSFLATFILAVGLIFSSWGQGDFYLLRLDNFFGSPLHKVNEPYTLAGEVAFIGEGLLQSVYVNWQVQGDQEVYTEFFPNIGNYPYVPWRWQLQQNWLPDQTGEFDISIWFSGLNGQEPDELASDTMQVRVEVYPQLAVKQMALLESFSSVICGSCALVTPALRKIVDENPEIFAMIYYHPFQHENSPLFAFNPKDQQLRRQYYQVFYTPFSVIGSLFNGGSIDVDNYLMFSEYEKWAGFALEGNWQVSQDSVLTVMVQGETFVNTHDKDYRLLITGLESEVNFDTPPGNNGEKDFFHVMRFFVPDANGNKLATSPEESGFEFEFVMDMPQGIDLAKLSLLAFVQEMNSREVSQVVRLQFLEEETEDPTHVPGVAGLETMLRVFPNPARDYLAIEPILNEPFTVSLFDMRGVQWLQTQNTHRIDVSQMPRGVYILRIEQSGMIYRSKVQLYP